MIATHFIASGEEVGQVLAILKIPVSSWYYRSTGTKQGIKASVHTLTTDGQIIPNREVVARIEGLLQKDFVDYGYIKVTHWLRQSQHLIINFKKVYRLMREHKLLYQAQRRDKKGKCFIQYRVPRPTLPFEHMEIDIKYIWLHGSRRMVYLLSVIDIKTRAILAWTLGYSMKQQDVVELMSTIHNHYCMPKTAIIRSDNGAQFEAKIVRDYLAEMGIQQEFSHVATPEDNGHIESYHAILKRAVCDSFEMNDLGDAMEIIKRFVHFYNYERLHAGVGYKSPNDFYFSLNLPAPHNQGKRNLIPESKKTIFLHQFVESDSS